MSDSDTRKSSSDASPATSSATSSDSDDNDLAVSDNNRDAPQKQGAKSVTLYDFDPESDEQGTKHTFWMHRLSKELTADLRKALAPEAINISSMTDAEQEQLEDADDTGEILSIVADEDGNVNMRALLSDGDLISLTKDCLYKSLEPRTPEKSNAQLEQFINEELDLDQIEELGNALVEHSNTSSVKKVEIG